MVDRILLAVDGSRNAYRAAEFTVRLLKSIPDSSFTIIIVIPFTRDEANYLGVSGPEFEIALEDRVQPLLRDIEQLFSHKGITPEKVVLQGDVAGGIVDYAQQGNFDLIVMGSRGLGNIKGMLLGSVSYKVMQSAHCPVTVVK